MKKLLLIVPFVVAFSLPEMVFGQNPNSFEKNTIYYFCTSRAWSSDMTGAGKPEVKYTEIKSTDLPENQIMSLTVKWANFAHLNCKYEKCTADLNYYKTAEEANIRMSELLSANKIKYELKLTEVKLE